VKQQDPQNRNRAKSGLLASRKRGAEVLRSVVAAKNRRLNGMAPNGGAAEREMITPG
jgi:hypothetical protein